VNNELQTENNFENQIQVNLESKDSKINPVQDNKLTNIESQQKFVINLNKNILPTVTLTSSDLKKS